MIEECTSFLSYTQAHTQIYIHIIFSFFWSMRNCFDDVALSTPQNCGQKFWLYCYLFSLMALLLLTLCLFQLQKNLHSFYNNDIMICITRPRTFHIWPKKHTYAERAFMLAQQTCMGILFSSLSVWCLVFICPAYLHAIKTYQAIKKVYINIHE